MYLLCINSAPPNPAPFFQTISWPRWPSMWPATSRCLFVRQVYAAVARHSSLWALGPPVSSCENPWRVASKRHMVVRQRCPYIIRNWSIQGRNRLCCCFLGVFLGECSGDIHLREDSNPYGNRYVYAQRGKGVLMGPAGIKMGWWWSTLQWICFHHFYWHFFPPQDLFRLITYYF